MAGARQPVGDMKRGPVTSAARCTLVAVVCGLALLAAGCGSSASSSSTAAAPSTSVLCADAAAVHASVDKLKQVTVGKGTRDEITADLNDVKTALTTFVHDASGQFQAETSALKSALAKLKTAVGDLAAHPSGSTTSGVKAARSEVTKAAQDLLAAVDPSCPSASPSSST